MGSPDSGSINWQTEVLPTSTQKALNLLAKDQWLAPSSWYLAGGTALALHVGHRASVDLDFFYPEKNFSLEQLLAHFTDNPAWQTDVAREGTVYGELAKAKISFIAYPFFTPAKEPARYGVVRVLWPSDIAVMKIVAISQRGRKRDFVDLYWYVQNQEPLADILTRVPNQYSTVTHNWHHILRSLMYFDDAEADPMPTLFFKTDWKKIKSYFQREVPKLTKEILDLK